MRLNQYALYRVNQTTKGKKLWHITYQEAFAQKIPIRIEYYKLMEIQSLQEGENLRKLWDRIQEQCEVSDIIVVNQAGTISFYYVDGKSLYPFPGFARKETGGSVISHDTENYEIKGKKGKWIVTDERIIDGKNFYLLEHQTYRNQAGAMILDREGKLILEDVKNGFAKDNIEKIQKLERQQKIECNHKQRLQQRYNLYQKKTEEKKQSYLMNAEMAEEQNYNMVDGVINNVAPKPKKMRESVLKKLHQKQREIAARSGKKVQEQELERNKNN